MAVRGLPSGYGTDGGQVDRVGLRPWLAHRGAAAAPLALVHLIGRSSPFSGAEAVPDALSSGGAPAGRGGDGMLGSSTTSPAGVAVRVVRAPKSGRSLADLGDFAADRAASAARARDQLLQLQTTDP